MRITDSAGNTIGYMAYDLSDGETTATIALTITPASGFSLSATPSDADVEIQGRENGSGDPFADLATPVDLSGHTPETPVDFDIRVVAADPLTGIRRVPIWLAVSNAKALAWGN